MPVTTAPALRKAFIERLRPGQRQAIERVVANPEGWQVYLVAGALRDLILGRALQDIDLTIEGDAIALADHVFEGRPRKTYHRFGTASIEIDDVRLDLAMARTETYDAPGALPSVSPATIEQDLRRRDFTMNALALRLSGEPVLLDPTGGLSDIHSRLIRVMHDASFQDDATRMFRALRYGARLAFTLEPWTRQILERDLGCIATLSGERLRHELELMLAEVAGGAALQAAHEAGVLRAIHPGLAWDHSSSDALERAARSGDRTIVGFALLAHRADEAQTREIIERLRLRRDEAAAMLGLVALRGMAHLLARPDVKPSGVVMLLDRFPHESVAAFAAITDEQIAASLALRYLDEWRVVKPSVAAEDLLEMGVPSGPSVGQALQLIRAAKLDGTARDLADERTLALRFVKSIRDSKAMNAGIDFHPNGN